MITTMVWTYSVYLMLCVGVTIWVARTLRKSGLVFLLDGDEERTGVADALSHLLIVGFYLVNFGLISLALKYGGVAVDVQSAIELLSTKVGGILVVLGAMHFVILVALSRARRNHQEHQRETLWREHASGQIAGERR